MNKAILIKVALVACLTVVGFGLPRPAAAFLNPCSWEYCNGNWNCNCHCEGEPMKCWEARDSGCIDPF